MDDLISRSAFEKFIKEKYSDNESTDDIKDQMLFDLSYQPTAYNLENVVAGVHNYFYKIIDDCNAENIPHEILKYNKEVCDIVRKGGVDD